MFDPIKIFLLIGLSHWIAHIADCPQCKRVFDGNLAFFMDGMISTLGWPVSLVTYLVKAFKPKQPIGEEEKAQIKKAVSDAISTVMAREGLDSSLFSPTVLDVSQMPNESNEAFSKRLNAILEAERKTRDDKNIS